MGLDLQLLPAFSQSENCDISHDILNLHRDDKLFKLILKVEKKKGVEIRRGGINSYVGDDETGLYEETCYGKTEISKYGERIKSLLASELDVIFSAYKTDSWKNKAIFAFVKELPKDLVIYLYWS